MMRKGMAYVVVAAIIVALGFLILRSAPPKPAGGHDDHGSEGHEEPAGEGAHNGAGEAGHEEHGGERFAMTDDQLLNGGIKLAIAGPRTISGSFQVPGEVSFNENRAAHIIARFDGRVTETRKNIGEAVRRGDVLALMDLPDMASLRADYQAAVSKSELTQRMLEREERLFERRISPERNYLEAKQAHEEAQIVLRSSRQRLVSLGLTERDLSSPNLSQVSLRSPLDGVVVEKHLSFGDAVSAGDALFLVADPSTLWVECALSPKAMSEVRVGQKVTVRSEALGEEVEGIIARLGASIGEQTRSAPAFVEIANPRGIWRPGLFVNVAILDGEDSVSIAVKEESIQTVEGRPTVFVREGEFFEARPVELGRRGGEWVEIVSGLSAGEVYAVGKTFLLKAEMGKASAGHNH